MKVVFQAVAVVILCNFLAVPGANAATSLAVNTPSSMFGSHKPNLVKFRLRNDLKGAVDLKIGEDPITIRPGQTIKISLPIGARITVAAAISGYSAGDLIAVVGSELDDTTVAIKH